ncbi:MAG: D-alanine--D-alanine ligase [Hahellaceae bacterium]|nr:D-alanine--D-alanine ligase [Hahellaceae bacterium]MCP5169857.1 D-alanine--D-alanine ligase [Hahellaceae bacterium]
MPEQVARIGKTIVLFGGASAERDVSLKSGRAVTEALISAGIDAQGMEVDGVDWAWLLTSPAQWDSVFIALHGRGGEDGTLQGMLESLRLPYTGSGVLASALAMDKLRTKQLWRSCDLPTPEFCFVEKGESLPERLRAIADELGLPLMVKAAHEGSSIGVYKVNSLDDLLAAAEKALTHDSLLLIEQWISGPEFTVAILGDEALPVIGLRTDHGFYDYDAKYLSNSTEYLLPSGLTPQKEAEIQALALRAFKVLGCKGWGRIDVMQDQEGCFWLLEANTVPGMTDHSLVPMAAKASGLSFEELVVRIIEESIPRAKG